MTGLRLAFAAAPFAAAYAISTSASSAAVPARVPAARDTIASADWLARLPDGEEKRRFILDCTGCHQFDHIVARADSGRRERTHAEWIAAVSRMLGFAGATSTFPVISHAREPLTTALWLSTHLAPAAGAPGAVPSAARVGGEVAANDRAITEFLLPVATDLPHDVAVDAHGKVVITGMFTAQMYILDPSTGTMSTVPTPRPNPRAVEIDAAGDWWVVLGAPNMVARYSPVSGEWKTYGVGMYPHSIALGNDGAAWANGHFTGGNGMPELVARLDAGSDSVRTFRVPSHPTLATEPGGPIPYEIRVAPDGALWMSELAGNRLLRLDPSGAQAETYEMPLPHSGPRRFDIDANGVLWIPAYAAGELVRFDPRRREFRRIALPIRDSAPYVVRVDRERGDLWIGTGAADAVFRFDPRAERFVTYRLPSRGAMVRHIAIDPSTHDVWLAYGASPGRIPARVARIKGAR